MANIWEAPRDIKQLVHQLKEQHYPFLSQASIWVLVSDSKAVRDNHIIMTQTKKCTRTEKLSTGCDFKIIVMAQIWANLTDAQRAVAIDEALARCGVVFEPEFVEINGKKEKVTDDLGRTVYSDSIAYDKEGQPRWKINPPDAGVYFQLVERHGEYNEEVENIRRVFGGQPVKGPMIGERADMIDEQLEV